MNWLGKLRTVAPVIGGYAASILAAWAAKKGFAISDTEATAIVAGGGHVLSKIIAGAGVNPNDAAAPSLVRNAPVPNVYVPVEVAPNDQSPYAPVAEAETEQGEPMPVIPLPTAAPTAASSQFIEGFECPFCGGDNNYHLGWCKLGGGNGVAPPGFANDTRRINHVHMRKLMADVESGRASPAIMEAVKQATAAPEPPRSPYLKPKVSEAEKSKDVVKVRRKPRKAR